MAKSKKKALPISKRDNYKNNYKNVFGLIKESSSLIYKGRKVFIKIIIIYAIVYLVLVLGFSAPGSVNSISSSSKGGISNEITKVSSSFNSFGLLLNSSSTNSSNPSSSVYGLILFIVLSLVLIWTIKEISLNHKINAKEAYYKSMTPFIPFVVTLVIMAIQLVPLSIAFVLYNYAIVGGIAVGIIEHLIWAAIILVLALISFYFISSSIFALLLTSLENLTPMKALSKARRLVKRQRLLISLKLIFLFLFISIVISLIMILGILAIPSVAPWLLQILLLVAEVFAYSYIFSMYKELNKNGFKQN